MQTHAPTLYQCTHPNYQFELPIVEIPAHFVSLRDYEQAILHSLPTPLLAYLMGNLLDDSMQLHAINQSALQQMRWTPRVLAPILPDLTTHLYNPNGAVKLDLTLPHPLFLSPTAYHQLFHPEGELASALACEVTQTSSIWSCLSNTAFAQLIRPSLHTTQQAFDAIHWYWQIAPENLTQPTDNRQLRAERNRAYNWQLLQPLFNLSNLPKLLIITVDAPHAGVREQPRRHGFSLPSDLTTPNLPDSPPLILQDLMLNAPNWSDMAWLIERVPIPILLKGILHPEDAAQAEKIGAAGVIVSNHGQRVLQDSIQVAAVLPVIRQRCASLVIFADGGVMTGSDIAKLLRLGADAVGIGRAGLYGLSVAGSLGMAHVLKILLEELMVTLAVTGIDSSYTL